MSTKESATAEVVGYRVQSSSSSYRLWSEQSGPVYGFQR